MKIEYQLSKRSDGVSSASLSSMIDIIFLLIIFFVITASFDREQVDSKIILPQVNSGVAIKSLPTYTVERENLLNTIYSMDRTYSLNELFLTARKQDAVHGMFSVLI